MVATLVRLKLKLLRNSLRSRQARIAVGTFSILGVALLFAAFAGAFALRQRPLWVETWMILVFAVAFLLWIVVPLLVGMTDGVIDPSRLSHLPVGGPRFLVGLLLASAAGVVPAFFFAAMLLTVVPARSGPEALYALLAVVSILLLCVVAAQVCSTSMSGLLRGRKTRDIAAATLGVLAMTGGLFMQFGFEAIVDSSLEQQTAVSRWLRWTPGGWLGQGIGWSRAGRWGAAIAVLVACWALVVALVSAWWRLLQRLLTTTEELGGTGAESSSLVSSLVRRLPVGEDVRAATVRALRSIRRDPREWAGIASQLPLLLVVGFPISQLDSDLVVLFSGTTGIYAGMLNSNLFGIDGRAVWIDQLAAPNLRPVIWGKTIAHALVVLPILAVVVVALAAWRDGWEYVLQAIGLAFATFGSISGAVAVASVRFAIPLPEGANPFAGQGTGASASQGLLLFGSLIVGFVLSLPAIGAIVGLSVLRWWLGALAVPFAIAWGHRLWREGVHRAADQAAREGPELLERLTIRS